MKKLVSILVLLLFVSCAGTVTTESGVNCYNHHICVGDDYTYYHTPIYGGRGYHTDKVHITGIRTGEIRIKQSDGHENWVKSKEFEGNSIGENMKHGQLHQDNGKHKGQYKY